MSVVSSILAASLSISTTNDYVYTKPLGIELNGSAAYGGEIIRGEDAAFALEAMKERNAALGFVSTNRVYNAAFISSDLYNDAQAAKSNALQRSALAAFVNPNGSCPAAFEVSQADVIGSVIAQIGGGVTSAGIDTSTVTNGSPVTAESAARLGSGLGAFTRVAFVHQGTTDERGNLTSVTGNYEGSPDLEFDYETGEFSLGTLPENPRPSIDSHGGEQLRKWDYSVTVSGSKRTYQSWKSAVGDYGLIWKRLATASSGPMFYTSISKCTSAASCQAFFPGNAARDSANATIVAAYVILNYYLTRNGETKRDTAVAIKVSASLSEQRYPRLASGYEPRIIISKEQAESLFSRAIEALGEERVTTDTVGQRIITPEVPQYSPITIPSYEDQYAENSNSSAEIDEQGISASGFVFVVDYLFNAREL